MNFVLYYDLSTGWSFSRTIIYIFMVSNQCQHKPSIMHNINEFCKGLRLTRVLQHAPATHRCTRMQTHMHLIILVAIGAILTIETQFSDNHTSSSIMFSPIYHIAFLTCSQCNIALMIGSLYFELPLNISFTFGELWDSFKLWTKYIDI